MPRYRLASGSREVHCTSTDDAFDSLTAIFASNIKIQREDI